MSSKINIVVADDHRIFCESFKTQLSQIPFIQHVYLAYNGAEAISLIKKYHIDLVLLDVRMPVMDGLEAADFILEHHPNVKVISMTLFAEDATILDILRTGSHGVLLKELADYEAIKMAINEVLKGNNYYCEEVNQILQKNIKAIHEPSRTRFTPREFDVLRLTCRGETAKEIARTLKLTTGSVENYRKELLKKSRTRNVAELVFFATKNGLV